MTSEEVRAHLALTVKAIHDTQEFRGYTVTRFIHFFTMVVHEHDGNNNRYRFYLPKTYLKMYSLYE